MVGFLRAPDMMNNGHVFKVLGSGTWIGLLCPCCVESGPQRAELAIPLELGLLHDIAVAQITGSSDD